MHRRWLLPSKSCQVVHIQGQIGNRGQYRGGSRGEQVLAVRVLCTQPGQRERGKSGDVVGPTFEACVNRAGAAEKIHRLHFQL